MTSESKIAKSNRPTITILILVLIFLILFLVYRYCRKPEFVIGEPVKAPVAVALIDANRYLDVNITKATITLIDEDSMVVTSNGVRFSQIDINGVISLGLKQKAEFSREKPYRFTLKVEAEGYSTNLRTILITEDIPYYVPIYLARTNDLPSGMAGFDGALSIENSTSVNEVELIPNYQNNPGGVVTVEIPKGTLFFRDECLVNKNADSINYRFSFGSPRSLNASRTFPGGPLVTDAFDRNGQSIATPATPFYFASAGWMQLEMKAGSEEVNRFSKPITISLPINDSLINPNTDQTYKAGDKIDTWSLSDKGIWFQDSIVTVQSGPSGLFAKMKIMHLSTWNLDTGLPGCPSDVTISYNNQGGAGSLFSEILNANTGASYGVWGVSPNQQLLNYVSGNGDFTIMNAPQGIDLEFRVYNNTTGAGTPFASSGQFPACTSPARFPIPAQTNFVDVKIIIRDAATTTRYLVCNNAIWVNDCTNCPTVTTCQNAGPYHFGGILTGGTNQGGTVRLYQNGAFGKKCLKLYYAASEFPSPPDPSTYEVTFPIDFAQSSETIAWNGHNITHTFSANIHEIILPSAGFNTLITGCVATN